MEGLSPLPAEEIGQSIQGVEVFCATPSSFKEGGAEWSQKPVWRSLTSCGHTSTSFGPEWVLGQALGQETSRDILIIKYAHGGTTLACEWVPDRPLTVFNEYKNLCPALVQSRGRSYEGTRYGFQRLILLVAEALASKAGDYPDVALEVTGFLWFQGESDAEGRIEYNFTRAYYRTNLNHFLGRLRSHWGRFKAYVGKITCSVQALDGDISGDALEDIRQAQQAVADNDDHTTIVDSIDLELSADGCHFTTQGMKGLGRRFAQAVARDLAIQ